MWQTPFVFTRYGIQSARGNGSGWHRRFGPQAGVRSPVSLHTEQHGKVLGRRKVFSVRTLSHNFCICGGGRSPISQEKEGALGSIFASNVSHTFAPPTQKQ